MNNKKTFFLVALMLALLLGGAALLYDRLGSQVQSPQLAIQHTPEPSPSPTEEPPAESPTPDTAETPKAEPTPDTAATPKAEPTPNVAEETPETEPTPDETEEAPEEELTPAPDFTVYDGEGNPFNLSDFRGKPVVLNFWASWCGPCQSEMPDFDTAFAQYGEDIHFLMVNATDGSRETVDTASSFIADSGYSFPVYYDTRAEAVMAYGAYSLPTTFFIDADGHAVAYGIGAMALETLERGIAMISPS